VQQGLDPLFQFDECTVIGQFADRSSHILPFRVTFGYVVPWILLHYKTQVQKSKVSASDDGSIADVPSDYRGGWAVANIRRILKWSPPGMKRNMPTLCDHIDQRSEASIT
jgi:hypothetical protein